MCGRYQLEADPRELAEAFGLADLPEMPARYNIAPTQDVAVVRMKRPAAGAAAERRLVTMRWGLVPHFAKDLSAGARAINARAETLDVRPAFRDAFRRRRCVVPASGFYEWRRTGRLKQPYLIRRRDRRLLAFAGLWARWRGPAGLPVDSCAIVTTGANGLVAPIYDRMPVVLEPAACARWLREDEDPGVLKSLLAPASDGVLEAAAVSSRVNDVACDDPECAAVLTDVPAERQKSLF